MSRKRKPAPKPDWRDNPERRAVLLAVAYDALKLTGQHQADGYPLGGFPRLNSAMEHVLRYEAERRGEANNFAPRGVFGDVACVSTVMQAIDLAKTTLTEGQLACVAADALTSLEVQP